MQQMQGANGVNATVMSSFSIWAPLAFPLVNTCKPISQECKTSYTHGDIIGHRLRLLWGEEYFTLLFNRRHIILDRNQYISALRSVMLTRWSQYTLYKTE